MASFYPWLDRESAIIKEQMQQPSVAPEERFRLFDAATARIRERAAAAPPPKREPKDRGWKREDLYLRRGPRA